jgi:hypothetical protein
MAVAGLEPILNRGNAQLNAGIDNKSIDGYSESTMKMLGGLVWD